MSDERYKPTTGRFARFTKLAGLGARLSTEVVGKGVKALRGKSEGLLGAGAAEKLVATLGDMKGLAMKLGQAMSMDPDLLTPEVRKVVSRLQNQAPPMPWSTVREVVTAELGAPPEERFASFEQTPLASASLGQVHGAITRDGLEVAVKVQYPGIDEALHSDLDNLGSMAKVVGRTMGLSEMKAYWNELRGELLKELDYVEEGERAQAFALAAAPLPQLVVPRVVTELTSEKVLTLERLRGPTLKELLNKLSEVPHDERLRLSGLLITALWGPFLASGVMHADPHPGNFLVLPDGRLGVLDFGSVKRVSRRFQDANRRLYLSLQGREKVDLWDLTLASGFTVEPEHLDEARRFVDETVRLATRPVVTRDFDYGSGSLNRELRNHFIKSPMMLTKLRPPPEAMMFFRALGGLVQNSQALGARGDFQAFYEALLPLAEKPLP